MSELEIAVRAVQIYAETHPRPLHVSQKQAAEMLSMCEPTIGKLVRAGKIKLNAAGKIPINQIDNVLMARDA